MIAANFTRVQLGMIRDAKARLGLRREKWGRREPYSLYCVPTTGVPEYIELRRRNGRGQLTARLVVYNRPLRIVTARLFAWPECAEGELWLAPARTGDTWDDSDVDVFTPGRCEVIA